MSEAFVEVDRVDLAYDEVSGNAIEDVSLSMKEHEFIAMVGPSGCGKSTFMKLCSGLRRPNKGQVIVEGRAVSGPLKIVGMAFQNATLLPWRTTLDNVLFALEVQGRLDDKTRAHAAMLMEAVGLKGYEKYYPHELSGGMRKRAALIRTLVYDPPVILMDEPFASVDAQTRMQLQEDLLRLWSLGRKTIVFVTHDIAEAIVLGDRTLVLSRQPTRIAAEHLIPFPRPRDVKNFFALPGFAAIFERIRAEVQ